MLGISCSHPRIHSPHTRLLCTKRKIKDEIMHVVCMIACFVYTKWNNYLQFQYFSREVPASYGEPLGYLLQLCLGTLLTQYSE